MLLNESFKAGKIGESKQMKLPRNQKHVDYQLIHDFYLAK